MYKHTTCFVQNPPVPSSRFQNKERQYGKVPASHGLQWSPTARAVICWLSGSQQTVSPCEAGSRVPCLCDKSPLVCCSVKFFPSSGECDAPSFAPTPSKPRVYPDQLSFKLAQKIHVSLGCEPLQKAWPEDYCSPVSASTPKHSQELWENQPKVDSDAMSPLWLCLRGQQEPLSFRNWANFQIFTVGSSSPL